MRIGNIQCAKSRVALDQWEIEQFTIETVGAIHVGDGEARFFDPVQLGHACSFAPDSADGERCLEGFAHPADKAAATRR